ncbi:single-stranded DNA-binding protein [Weissella sagaensis]|jgi:single-strand DNA-binding protein|uniref:Single-stranded DNA-binding protein n=1 Tax=Weissella sagaensis TaxID=2559928 RepID=A0ABW1RSE2_9LACO|nr:single-stranded DNA-binding protein [Weissella sagaensis]KAA8433989.1 single-stranded DNA-binding protein [Weissella paramesenteroides]QDJ58226.1 single-stranded DNA-binding protein [Weissella hellenica]KAA8438241.1 single-stranded DNA-binding protein [Weissella paramesenteroides]QEA57219.1 single-stranded DNA-binding protein [Weissella hellenica]UEG66335.1 single-stranded DNA-binding protein [Weissella hellenica]
MINRVVLIGRLTRDVELRYTTNGSAVASFSLAVNRQFTNANGERDTDFINAVIWRKAAENFANFTSKGSLVGIEGRIQTRNYENQQGQRVYVTEVVVENFSLLESRAESEARRSQNGSNNTNNFGGGQQASQGNYNASASQNPFGAPASNGNVFNGNNSASSQSANDPFGGGQEIEISDDQLPF